MDVELKPCPFCGREPELIAYSESTAVRCDNDQCIIWSPEPIPYNDHDHRTTAITAWNNRHGDADRSAELTTAWMAGAESVRDRAARDRDGERSVERRALLWFAGDDSGLSSHAIAHHMLGMESRGDNPWDPADLGRCLRLLELFPEWKPRIGEMSRYSQRWAGLCAQWDSLSAMMADEVGIDWSKGRRAPKTYAAMQAAIDSARAGERG